MWKCHVGHHRLFELCHRVLIPKSDPESRRELGQKERRPSTPAMRAESVTAVVAEAKITRRQASWDLKTALRWRSRKDRTHMFQREKVACQGRK